MKTLTVILLAGMATGISALAAPREINDLPPGAHPDYVTLATKRADVDWSKLPPTAKTAGVTFEKDIAPLFKDSCVRCHGAERPKAQLRLDTLEGVLKGTKQGSILKAGDSANSLLVKSVSQLDPETAMPPKPRVRRGPGGPEGSRGTNAPALREHQDGSPTGEGQPPRARNREGDDGPGGERPRLARGEGERATGTNAPGQRSRPAGPAAKPLTAEQVGLVRAWIDQGAK